MGHTCSRVLSAIISRAASPRTSTSSAPAAASAPVTPIRNPSAPAAKTRAHSEPAPERLGYSSCNRSVGPGVQALLPGYSAPATAAATAAVAAGCAASSSVCYKQLPDSTQLDAKLQQACGGGTSSNKHSRLSKYVSLRVDVNLTPDQGAGLRAPGLKSASASPGNQDTYTTALESAGTSVSYSHSPATSAVVSCHSNADDADEYIQGASAPAAAAALMLRLQSPRAECRRREGGKWGRRHWAQQQQHLG